MTTLSISVAMAIALLFVGTASAASVAACTDAAMNMFSENPVLNSAALSLDSNFRAACGASTSADALIDPCEGSDVFDVGGSLNVATTRVVNECKIAGGAIYQYDTKITCTGTNPDFFLSGERYNITRCVEPSMCSKDIVTERWTKEMEEVLLPYLESRSSNKSNMTDCSGEFTIKDRMEFVESASIEAARQLWGATLVTVIAVVALS